MNDKIKKLTEILRESENIVFFGGAGTSTESGIPDFRSADGIFLSDIRNPTTDTTLTQHTFRIFSL